MITLKILPSLRLIRVLAFTAPLWLAAALIPGGFLPALSVLALLFVLCARDLRRIPPPAQISVQRDLPPRFTLGEEQLVSLSIVNRSSQDLTVQIRDEAPAVFGSDGSLGHARLPALSQTTCRYPVRPSQRGLHQFGRVHLRIQHDTGLIQKEFSLPLSAHVKVFPQFRNVKDYQLLARIDERDEVVRKPRRVHGPGTDFESLRPYLPGEDLRNIDWKASARRAAWISRQRQVEKGQQIALLLDAGRLMGEVIGTCTKLDHALNAAILLSYVAQKRGDTLAAASFSNRIESFLPPVRGSAIVPRVLDNFYRVQVRPVESDYWQVMAEVMTRLRRRSLLILLTDVLDACGSAGLINNLKRAGSKHLVLCVVLSDPLVRQLANSVPQTPAETYRKAAACDLLRRRRLALEHMRSQGTLVLESDPSHLSVQLVRRYLQIRKADLQ